MASAGRARNDEKNEKLIRALSKLKENKTCINCNSLVPQYVCTNFWTFVCLTCSGIHREFTHRVKSISMSKFTAAEVAALNSGGNQRARDVYLKKLDFTRNGLPDSSNVEKLRSFIKQVYVERRYAAEGLPPKYKVVDDYGRFSVDSRYQEDLFDAGRFSLTSYGGGSDSIIRGSCVTSNGDGDSSGHLSSSYRRKNSDGDSVGGIHLSNGNDQGDRMRRHSNYSVYRDQKLNQKDQSRNIVEYAGRENFSQKLGKAEIGPLNGDCKTIYKLASFSNENPAEHSFPVFQRANSDSLIDFGTATDDCKLAKEIEPNLFESQGLSSAYETWASSVNEGWATFDVHPSPPPIEVATRVTDPNSLVQTGHKQTSDSKTFSLQSYDGSVDAQPSYPHQLSKETPQQQNPFSLIASVFEDSHQPGGMWELYNISMTTTACVDLSNSDHKQHSKESSSSFVEHQKSKNPFDIPEDYEPASTSSINVQFPSMDSLQMALPALGLESNSVPIPLQPEWAANEISNHQPFNSCPAVENYSSRTIVSSPLQVASFGCAMQNVNLGAQCVGSVTSAGAALQLPFQSSSQSIRSNNPFD